MSGYMGAFQDFVQEKDDSGPGQRSQPRAAEPVASTSASSELDYTAVETLSTPVENKPSSSGSKAKPGKRPRRPSSDDDSDDDDSETDVADDKASSTESEEDSEPRAVAKRPRTQRSAKQKILSKMSSRGRGRGRGLSSSVCLTFCNKSSSSEQQYFTQCVLCSTAHFMTTV